MANHQHNSEWVTFPALPSPKPFSSAVAFVSTTFKPFTHPTPPAPLPSPSMPPPSPTIKRLRTQTGSAALTRKRSKSDLGRTPTQARRSQSSRRRPADEPPVFLSSSRSLCLRHSACSRPFGSSASLTSEHARVTPSHRQSANPPGLVPHRQRTSTTLAHPVPSSAGPLQTTTPVSRCSTPSTVPAERRTRQRAKTVASPSPSPRSTYLGGLGEYLEKSNETTTGTTGRDRRRARAPSNLTIDVNLCKSLNTSSNHSQGWYNRLVLSPISSASSSVIGFLAGHQTLADERVEEEEGVDEEVDMGARERTQDQYIFRTWDF